MPVYKDQLGREVVLHRIPKRIISVVPSQTELLYDLGLEDEVIGITKFCVHPEQWFRKKERVGGTKMLHLERIRTLSPDLIIANKEENIREQIEELAKDFPVWVSDVNNLAGAMDMIRSLGDLTGRSSEASAIINKIEKGFQQLKKVQYKPKTCYLIWKDPYMTIGGDTFIHDILNRAGLDNVFASFNRYPQVEIKLLQELSCEWILLSSEPYPFKEKHVKELQEQLPGTKILLVDGEMFSWYGSRLVKAPDYLKQLQEIQLAK
jgi:ABC-type Fe3+-hydroxamate transport system substrate-binding protein